MRGYTVHLLFHLLAMAAGAACGVAGGLWWFGGDPTGLWLAIGALVVGIIVLILENLYISASQPPPYPPPPAVSHPRIPMPPQRPRERTRPDLEPAAPPPETLLQPSMDVSKAVDQETKTAAAEALDEQWTSNPTTKQS
ncbi:hypothetical protein MOQ72_21190 [Saccharopolyspora sp. K220]|uniref:hypothetical protein n=1 Tax=Saccharopolyspora soli TaxID=2926618 RepID=UPI001F5877C8|nr:hypothetical protein [Saccharopolyspora soli]MCI2419966.1 hypothetical protein [Saccharopolyspora soli]